MKCFKCETEIGSALADIDPWEAPCNAALFEGGWTYGSSFIDAGIDGIYIELIICDKCLIESANKRKMRRTTTSNSKEII